MSTLAPPPLLPGQRLKGDEFLRRWDIGEMGLQSPELEKFVRMLVQRRSQP